MRKKHFFWAAIVLLSFFGHGCDNPMSLEIKIKTDDFKLGIPTRIGTADLAAILTKQLGDSLPEGFEWYDVVNYPGGTQAFLISYTTDLTESFDVDKYLDDIKEQMNMDNIKPDNVPEIKPDPIKIPRIAWDEVPETTHPFDMSALFRNMEDVLNTTSTPKTPVPFPATPLFSGMPSITIDMPELPNFMAFHEEEGTENFTSVRVADGKIILNLRLENQIGNLDDLAISFNDIAMKGEVSKNYIGNPKADLQATLDKDNGFSTSIEIDLEGEEIVKDDPPYFTIGSVTVSYTGTNLVPEIVSFTLVIQPQIENIFLRGAKGLKIGEMRPDLPSEIVDTIKMDMSSIPPEFLNAEIEKGALVLKGGLPESTGPGTTYCTGIDIQYIFYVKQENKEGFEGLGADGKPWEIAIGDTSDGSIDLRGQKINGNEIEIVLKKDVPVASVEYSQVIIKSDPINGADFELYGTDYDNKELPVTISMEMNIEELKVVRWKLENDKGEPLIPEFDVDDIDFGNIDGKGTDISKFIESITFGEIKLGIDFTIPEENTHGLEPGSGLPDLMRNRFAIKVHCTELGFDNTSKRLDTELEFSSKPTTLKLKDEDGNAKKFAVDVDFIPVIGHNPDPGNYVAGVEDEDSTYIELGPLILGNNGDTELILYGTVDFDFVWTEAKINLKEALKEASPDDLDMFDGEYPENQDEYFNQLYDMREYMKGFTLNADALDMRVYLGGTQDIFDILSLASNLELDLFMSYKEKEDESIDDDDEDNWVAAPPELILDKFNLQINNAGKLSEKIEPGLVTLTGSGENKIVYDFQKHNLTGGIDIKDNLETVLNIIASLPRDMRLNYKMDLPEETVTVTPDTFDFDDDEEAVLKVMVVVLIPLEFIAKEGAYVSIPDNIFGDDNKDLFGRGSPDEDSPFTDLNVKSVRIKIDFDSAFLNRAYLEKLGTYVENSTVKNFPDQRLRLDGRNSLEITLTNKEWEIIKNYPIAPDIWLTFDEGEALRISRNFMPTKITITASGSYTVQLDM